jgi:hypothetical protein
MIYIPEDVEANHQQEAYMTGVLENLKRFVSLINTNSIHSFAIIYTVENENGEDHGENGKTQLEMMSNVCPYDTSSMLIGVGELMKGISSAVVDLYPKLVDENEPIDMVGDIPGDTPPQDKKFN